LKELLFTAPGSYHHSIIVGNMVEAAAESIGANPLLAKVAAYYHDIGKIKKPLYFIENQADGENRHEKLAPSMSALILISHVKDGVEIAREAKLGKPIRDIIAQHHGTSLITYFYDKSIKTKSGKEKVNIEDFRYPGPKPQTREAGLVLLADQVEAACKSLSEPTPSRIQGTVQHIINKNFSDDQLSDCELTLKDLHAIAKTFAKVLHGIYHQRIIYPEISVKTGGAKRKTNGDSTPRRSGKGSSRSNQAQAERSDRFKGIGI
jgi:putative nucleotidyltransferase with HDIG domain